MGSTQPDEEQTATVVGRLQSTPPAEDLPPVMTAPEAAKLLGVSSPNTVKNWLEGGHFPGAYRTVGRHWRIPSHAVLEVKRRMMELRLKNQVGDLMPPDLEDDAEPPVL